MNRNQRLIIAGLLTAHFVLLYLALSRNLDFLFNDASHRIGPGSDFWAMHNAGKHWRLGGNIYGQGPGYGFRYHPILAMTLLALLSHLKHTVAYFVWVCFHEVLLMAVLAFARRMISSTRHFLVALAVVVLFTPYYLEVYMGNASFIAAVLLIMAFYYFKSHPNTRFFPLYLLSVLIKPIGLLFIPVLLFRHQIRLALITVIVYAGLALPYFISHAGDWLTFARVNFDWFPVPAGFLVHGGSQGLYALVLRASAALHDIPTYSLGSLAQLPEWNMVLMRLLPYVLVVVSLWATVRLRKTPHLALTLFIWSATYLMGYKDVWEHSYSFLVFGFLYLYLSGIVSHRLLLICCAGVALPTAFAFYDITFYRETFNDPDWHWSWPVSMLHHATKPVWLVGLYVVVVYRVLRGKHQTGTAVTSAP